MAQQPNPATEAIKAWFEDAILEPLGAGHIHDTFKVEQPDGSFVLQRVNEYVFRDGDLVMGQTERLLNCWSAQDRYVIPELVASRSGLKSVRDETGLWRVWRFIEGGRTLEILQDSL